MFALALAYMSYSDYSDYVVIVFSEDGFFSESPFVVLSLFDVHYIELLQQMTTETFLVNLMYVSILFGRSKGWWYADQARDRLPSRSAGPFQTNEVSDLNDA